jgi:hypothetical protein
MYLIVKTTVLPHRNFNKYISTTLDGKVVHILKDRRLYSFALDVWFSGEMSVKLMAVW